MDIGKKVWSSWYSKHEGAVDEEIPRLTEFFKSKSVSRILDLGCGTGRHVIYLAERGFDVYGFDLSAYAVKRAEERLKAKNLVTHLIVFDMRKKLPYGDEFFDAVISVRVIHHARIRVIKRSILEVKRILKKNGYLYADVPSRPRGYHESNLKFVEPGTRIPLDGSEKGILHHDFTEEEIQCVLKDFEIQEVQKKNTHFHILARKSR